MFPNNQPNRSRLSTASALALIVMTTACSTSTAPDLESLGLAWVGAGHHGPPARADAAPRHPALDGRGGHQDSRGLHAGSSRGDDDANGDGDLDDASDHVYLYFGQRRGGSDIFSMDVTDPDVPKLRWVIKGGTGDFADMGQTLGSAAGNDDDDALAEIRPVCRHGGQAQTDSPPLELFFQIQ